MYISKIHFIHGACLKNIGIIIALVFVSRLEFSWSCCPNCGIIQLNYPCKHLTRSQNVRLFSYISVLAP